MNALSYIASDPWVQNTFLVMVCIVIVALILSSNWRKAARNSFREKQFEHAAYIERERLKRELTSVEGKALPTPRPQD